MRMLSGAPASQNSEVWRFTWRKASLVGVFSAGVIVVGLTTDVRSVHYWTRPLTAVSGSKAAGAEPALVRPTPGTPQRHTNYGKQACNRDRAASFVNRRCPEQPAGSVIEHGPGMCSESSEPALRVH